MRVRYSPNSRIYDEYYSHQRGNGIPVYIGGMRGGGLGNVLNGLFRAAVPLLKKGGKAVLREGVSSGLKVAQDVLSGKNLKSSLKRHAHASGKRLYNKAIGEFTAPPGQPAHKRIRKSGIKLKKRSKKSKSFGDIFG